MNEPERASSGISDWIPEARLDAGIRTQTSAQGQKQEGSDPGGDGGPRRSWGRPALAAIAVGVAVSGGTFIGLLASGGENGGGSTVEPEALLDTERRPGEPRPDERRVPLVAELTNLTPGEASVLAAVARARDRRTDASEGREEDGAQEPSNSLLPIDSDDRYRYLRRVGAVAVTLAELGDLAKRTRPFATADGLAAQVRPRLDRLSLIIARLSTGPYLRSRRLSVLVTAATLRLGSLAAGDFRPENAAQLRRLSLQLGKLGRSIAADLERAADLASGLDFTSAARLLADVDRKLGEIAPPQ